MVAHAAYILHIVGWLAVRHSGTFIGIGIQQSACVCSTYVGLAQSCCCRLIADMCLHLQPEQLSVYVLLEFVG
jgi:hypothetical protein